MLHASTKKLIDRLAEMTDLAKLDWTDGDDGNITYSTEGYSVLLTETPNEMVITSKDGKELERAGAEELAGTPAEDGGTYADIVATMTKEAARVARGTEAAISTLLAGMQEAPAEPDASESDLQMAEDAETELQEDPGDETAVLTDDSVEAVSSDAEHAIEMSDESASEADDEPEAAIVLDASDETEAETEPETDVSSEPVEATEAEADELDYAAPIEQMAETDLESAPESEDDVTEAVVRLADEVNQREDNGLDAAAASAVGAVALAAGLTTSSEESEPEAEEPAPVEPEPVAAFAVADGTPAEAPVYVPFGLEESSESTAAVESETVDASAEEVSAPVVESASVLSFNGAETPKPEAEAEAEAETGAPVSEQAAALAPMQAASEETTETVEETISEPETPVMPEPAPEVPAFTVAASAVEEETAPTPAEEPAEPVEPLAEAPQPAEAQTYSLSGIGAGFGLGALSTKSEASGIPGPTSFGAAEEEKVVIDATEDVLPEIDGKPALPASVAAIPPATSSDGDTANDASADAEAGEADILKPRTRFNPWD